MEQTSTLLNERDTKLLGSLEDRAVVLRTAGCSDVLDAGAGGSEDVVDEGELFHQLA